ncbi:XrtA/PEP-CTERM system amidotransferase [Inmirania thermothiophila]|uniref:asparagine synthase (glutamine-hydrolyzing) n=1 Tax=Inmirania thermothiophila TaxID=1750597 RepID=A0A3N1Y7J3_9GAMM|nr:XrtA/PEP-CTERM system amidotransferase [Inmirania thermothiophila]ROR34745.1 asparagine synthase (glutamine-hydrolysing) [Inmirania thermothiophila]
MCGLTALFDLRDRRPVDQVLLARMTRRLAHRGPDGEGLHCEPGVGLGHRRLAIIDLAGGTQPLANEDGRVWVAYNGEIYNFAELMAELEALGHRFRTRCDTEVIVHAWEAWGERCVERFRGMFAFALWDGRTQTLFLARDRLGIKPLFYAALADGWLAVASELKALALHPALPRTLDPRAVESYFAYGYVPEPHTIHEGVLKLPPGHTLTVRRGRPLPAPAPYWDVPFVPHGPMDEAEAAAELVERIREAVRIRLVAEVPLGAFLSGGVDSSTVVATMAGLVDGPVNTCSISFGDPAFNEAAYAARVAERYRTDHRVRQVDPDDFDLVDRLVEVYDEPYADSSAMPTYRVCELARERVTVALSGDGGDENLAGYRRYRWHVYEERLRARLPLALRRPLFGLLGRIYPKMDWAPKVLRAKATLESLARDAVEGYFHSVSVLGDPLRARLWSEGFRRALGGFRAVEVLEAHAARAPVRSPLSLVQYLDLKTYLVGDILTKVDRASMAHALEVRVPLLDHELVAWISGLPESLKLRGREGKYLLKRAMEPLLPREILYRPKMGFAVPLARWFRGPLRRRVREAVLGEVMADAGIFDMDFLRRLVEQHQAGLRDHSAALWSLLMFEGFLRRQAGAAAVPPARGRTG